MASIQDLYAAIQAEVRRTSPAPGNEALIPLFLQAIRTTMVEIKHGADSDAFEDLVTVNFIIAAAQEGHPVAVIKSFVHSIAEFREGLVYEEDTTDDDLFLQELVTGRASRW